MLPFSAMATGSVVLAWNPSASANVSGYKIYYGVACGTYTNSISVGDATNVTVNGLIEGTTYYFAATAVDALGVESPFSNEASYLVPVASTSTNAPLATAPGLIASSTPSVSSPALAPPSGGAPAIVTPPQTQTVEAGSGVRLAASVTGNPPPAFQWFFNGNAIAGSTNSLSLAGLQATNVGAYTLVARNAYGAVTSTPAMLNVISPVARRSVPALNLTAPLGSVSGLDYCDGIGSAAGWKNLVTVTLTNSSQFCFDLSQPLPPQRLYRAWRLGLPGAGVSLSMNFVPAITMTGSVGSTLRLDYINAVGPTNAWVTLDTVTLTNTSQLYFDTSMLGQPGRLYRIVPGP